jgi:hypothetical protein
MTSVRAFFVLVPHPLTRTFVLFAPSLIPVWDLVSAGGQDMVGARARGGFYRVRASGRFGGSGDPEVTSSGLDHLDRAWLLPPARDPPQRRKE